jgi:ribosomal protein L27
MTFKAGPNAGLGHDYSVYAKIDGTVHFEHVTHDKKRIRIEALAGE